MEKCMSRRFRLSAVKVAGVGALAVVIAACGSSGASSSGSASGSGGLPSSVQLYSIQDSSGSAGSVGVDDQQGANLAVRDINNSRFLGATKLSLSYGDSATSPTTAANVATQAVSAHYPIVFGPPSSGTAVAVAPILAKANQPTVFTQAGSDGTLVSSDMFRMTTLQTDRYPLALKWLQSKGVKTIAVLQDSDFPTEVQLTQVLQSQAHKYGLSVVGVVSALAKQSNLSAEVSKLLSYNAQALALNVVLTQNATAATLAQQGHFTGPIIAEDGAGNGSLNGAGAAGNGIVWSSDWVPGAPFGATSDTFTNEYQAAYHKAPSNWAAESYDAVWYAARGLKQAGSTDPAKVQAALTSVGKATFNGVLGRIVVTKGQEYTQPILVQWMNGQAVPMNPPSS
jgi:branched-chain amino acid transport system substrate-binding protein